MEMIENLFNSQFTILILILTGSALAKFKMLNGEFRNYLTDFVINFILPCNIIKSFTMEFNGQIMRDCLAVCVVSAVTQVLSLILGKVMYRHL